MPSMSEVRKQIEWPFCHRHRGVSNNGRFYSTSIVLCRVWSRDDSVIVIVRQDYYDIPPRFWDTSPVSFAYSYCYLEDLSPVTQPQPPRQSGARSVGSANPMLLCLLRPLLLCSFCGKMKVLCSLMGVREIGWTRFSSLVLLCSRRVHILQ